MATDAPPARPIIEAVKLVKVYGLMPVLRGLDLSIQRGEFVALLGANGNGKSTFLRLLTGLTRPTSGTLRIGGWEMPQEAAAVRAQLGLVSHRSLLYDNLTARENLLFFGRLYNLPQDALNARVDELLRQVGLYKRAHDLPRQFSRGMLQRLSIARALIHTPEILLFDEPHTGLDQSAAQILDNLLTTSHAQGRTIIMVTHHIERAAELVNRALIIHRGTLAYDEHIHNMSGAALADTYRTVTGETA